MPLSEHEQRLLEQMERALLAEDPKFATSMSAQARLKADRRGAAVGVISFVGGVALLMTGVISQLVPIGIAGFVAMLAGAFLTFRALRHRSEAPASNVTQLKGKKKSPKGKNSSLSDRMEERWRDRRERGEF